LRENENDMNYAIRQEVRVKKKKSVIDVDKIKVFMNYFSKINLAIFFPFKKV